MAFMNPREEFLHNFRSVFISMVERLETMTESQVLDGILEVKAARSIYEKEFAERLGTVIHSGPSEGPRRTWATPVPREELASLAALQELFNSVNRLNELRSRVGAKARPLGTLPFGALEDALNARLESLRKRPSADA